MQQNANLRHIFYNQVTEDTKTDDSNTFLKHSFKVHCYRETHHALVSSPSRCGAQITYFGICLNISEFGVNIYLTQLIFAAIEFPTKTGAYFFIERIGRRPGEMGALLSTGVCLLINLFLAKGNLKIYQARLLLFPAQKLLYV